MEKKLSGGGGLPLLYHPGQLNSSPNVLYTVPSAKEKLYNYSHSHWGQEI